MPRVRSNVSLGIKKKTTLTTAPRRVILGIVQLRQGEVSFFFEILILEFELIHYRTVLVSLSRSEGNNKGCDEFVENRINNNTVSGTGMEADGLISW